MIDTSFEAQPFLQKHVYANCNDLIQHLLKGAEGLNAEWANDLFRQHEEFDSSDYCPDPDPEFRKPVEFYIVSPEFANHLKNHNELLTNPFGFYIWGREITDQSILLDYVFQQFLEKIK